MEHEIVPKQQSGITTARITASQCKSNPQLHVLIFTNEKNYPSI
jgi:hypothetical protein